MVKNTKSSSNLRASAILPSRPSASAATIAPSTSVAAPTHPSTSPIDPFTMQPSHPSKTRVLQSTFAENGLQRYSLTRDLDVFADAAPSATLYSGFLDVKGNDADMTGVRSGGWPANESYTEGTETMQPGSQGKSSDLVIRDTTKGRTMTPLQNRLASPYGEPYAPSLDTAVKKDLEDSAAAKEKLDRNMNAIEAQEESDSVRLAKLTEAVEEYFSKIREIHERLNAKQCNSKKQSSLITKGPEQQQEREQNVLKSPEAYTQPFCDFLTENPTVWHAVQYFEKKLAAAGFKKLSERQTWTDTLEKGGKYYTTRNGSSLIAFAVGNNYKSGNGVAMIAGHVDALTARLKAVSAKNTTAGYVQLGVAPYAGALNSTWWDRDLGIGGRVLVKDSKTGKIETKLVKLGWPIARIPTLAPHFGVGMTGSNNAETEAVPIIGLDNSSSSTSEFENLTLGGAGSFTATQPPKLVRAIAGELSVQDYSSIVNWELELYDTQPAQVGGLDKEFIFAGRIDDKLCSWSAMEALLASSASTAGGESDDAVVKLVGVFDDEEIGSLLRQGARGNFLPSTIERIAESFSSSSSANILSQTYANSFLISADVTHAVNPNFLSRYLESHAPRLNVGLVVCADSNGHMTTDSVSTALLTRVAEKTGSELQVFAIRNDSRSGGTVGPMLSSAMGVRAIDAGIPQLSMHSIRATTGSLDPGLGVKIFAGFFEHFQGVDAEFE